MTDVSNGLEVNNNKFTETALTGLREGGRIALLILPRGVATGRDFLVTLLDIVVVVALGALEAFGTLVNVDLVALRALERVDTAIVGM